MIRTPRPWRLASTLRFPSSRRWMSRVDFLDPRGLSRLALGRLLLEASTCYDALILDGSEQGYRDVIPAQILARAPGRRSALILADCTWKLGAKWLDRLICKVGCGLLDVSRVSFCVLSSAERERFAQTWKLRHGNVFHTPWSHCLTAEQLAAPTSEEGGVFAGGDSLREYLPLIEAARSLAIPVTIASRRFRPPSGLEVPSNVRIGPVSEARYDELSRQATVVVVPLEARGDRSAGQYTYLSAMAMGKAVVVTDVMGVSDHVEHGRTGLIVPPGDAAALRNALHWVVDPAHRPAIERMKQEARAHVRRHFGPEQYAESLLAVADRALARLGAQQPAAVGLTG